jgi:hypothetical protein
LYEKYFSLKKDKNLSKQTARAKRLLRAQQLTSRPFYSRNLERVLYPHRSHLSGDAFIPWRMFRRLTRSFRLDRW